MGAKNTLFFTLYYLSKSKEHTGPHLRGEEEKGNSATIEKQKMNSECGRRIYNENETKIVDVMEGNFKPT